MNKGYRFFESITKYKGQKILTESIYVLSNIFEDVLSNKFNFGMGNSIDLFFLMQHHKYMNIRPKRFVKYYNLTKNNLNSYLNN